MIWTHSIPHPPVPQFLRETLKDYPEIIQDIQEVLNRVVTKGPPRFDWAYDRLTDTLSAHCVEAREALEAAHPAGVQPNPALEERYKSTRVLEGQELITYLLEGRSIPTYILNGQGSPAAYAALNKYNALVEAKRGPSFDELHDYFETYKGAFE
jgi:hypothetical protein